MGGLSYKGIADIGKNKMIFSKKYFLKKPKGRGTGARRSPVVISIEKCGFLDFLGVKFFNFFEVYF